MKNAAKAIFTLSITFIVVENEIGDPRSNSVRSCLHFIWHKCPWKRLESISSPTQRWVNFGGRMSSLGSYINQAGKLWIQTSITPFKKWPSVATLLCGGVGYTHTKAKTDAGVQSLWVSFYFRLVVHSIRFQNFFVQAFKIVVNSWKFTMLLLYNLWDDWPIFMISRSNQQLQQQLEYTLLKPDCHSWWISRMQSRREEERYAIKFCFKLGKMPCDESWIYCYDPETKRQGSQWKHAGYPRPKKARQSKSSY